MIDQTASQRLSWFIGVLEGKGSSVKYNGAYKINITDTNFEIIEVCTVFLDTNSIVYEVKKAQRENKKLCYEIIICGCNNCQTLIKVLGDHFQCRYDEFAIDMDYLNMSHSSIITSDLYWLVGIFEAKGSIGLYESSHKYAPFISIESTNKRIFEKVTMTLRVLGISWKINISAARNFKSEDITVLALRNIDNCKKFLRKISGLFVSDHCKLKAKVLLEFCDLRVNKRTPYTKRDHELYEEMRLINLDNKEGD